MTDSAYTGIYVTDSDDYVHALQYYPIYWNESFFAWCFEPDTHFENWYIREVQALAPNPPLQLIPLDPITPISPTFHTPVYPFTPLYPLTPTPPVVQVPAPPSALLALIGLGFAAARQKCRGGLL